MIRYELLHGDCLEKLKELPDCSVDAVVTDPPYDLTGASGSGGFMGKKWDATGIAFRPDVWLECLRVLKPGGHLLAFGGTRTYHRMACAIEDAGFEVRDSIHWMYGCLSEDTEILVNGEWCRYSKVVEGAKTLCFDIESNQFSWQAIEQKVVYGYDDAAYRLFSENTDQVVSRNHRCVVMRDGKWQFVYAEALDDREFVPVVRDAARRQQEPMCDLVRVEPVHIIGKVWCVKVPTGAFVARRLGQAFVTGNSGFPKGHDISKAIDRMKGAERLRYARAAFGASFSDDNGSTYGTAIDSTPITPEAAQWAGWNVALKPAHEPVVVARKKLIGTVAQNVLEHGTGGLNIDGCRLTTGATTTHSRGVATSFPKRPGETSVEESGRFTAQNTDSVIGATHAGRWPPNVIFSHLPECSETECAEGCAVRELDEQSGIQHGTGAATIGGPPRKKSAHIQQMSEKPRNNAVMSYGDSGGASRFFPAFRYQAKAPPKERKVEGIDVRHVTQKPVELMRWLVRLVTPPGGVVLDPFTGSGTTGVAAIREGFRFIGCEREDEYFALAKARLDNAVASQGSKQEKQPMLFDLEET